jgi:predicted permease
MAHDERVDSPEHDATRREGLGARKPVTALRGGALADLRFDLRFALRSLRRNPAFTVVALVTFAVGMGATTSMLSVANAVLLRPPPIVEPDRVVSIWEFRSGSVRESMEGRLLSYERYEALRDATGDAFVDLAGHAYANLAVVTDEGAVAVNGFTTSGNYFSLLGLTPQLGRLFDGDDEEAVVLSERLWRSRYGGDPSVIGRTISIDSRGFTITGVAPAGFVGTMTGFTGDLWIPQKAYLRLTGLSDGYVVPIGRLRPGVDRPSAEERVAAAARAIPPVSSGTTVRGARLEGLQWRTDLRETLTAGMLVMLGASVLLLLVACANIAGMILARSYDRRREIAVRLAIGAGGGRLVRQMLAESVLLALMGGSGGVLLAYAGTAALSRIDFPIDATITFDATPDPVVLVASFGLAALTGILFGLGPALRSARIDLTTSLKEGARGARMSRRRTAFVVAQMALSTLLLVTSGLFVRSFERVANVPLGFDPDGVLVASLSLEPHGYGEEERTTFLAQVVERVRAVPGVEAVALARFVLLGGANASHGGTPSDGGPEAPSQSVAYNVVDPDYFTTNRMELVEGRLFTDADVAGGPRVAVVNETLAERMWPGRSAVGRSYRTGGSTDHQVVGVIRDGVYVFVYEEPRAFAYYPATQRGLGGVVHVRAAGPLAPVAAELRRIVRELDANVAVSGLRTMEEIVGSNRFIVRFLALLTTLCAAIGLLLAAIGVYGLLAVQVAQRRRELGVRMALGAKALDVILLVLRRGVTAAALGCALGLALATGSGRVVGTLLYEVSPVDTLTFALVPTVLLLTAATASAVPARRATRVSPTVTLREE